MEARGQPIPKFLVPPPLVTPEDQFYLSGFWELSTCRQFGFGIGPIPWGEVIRFAQFAGLDDHLTGVFLRTIRAMDTVYMEWWSKKNKSKEGSGNKGPGKGK